MAEHLDDRREVNASNVYEPYSAVTPIVRNRGQAHATRYRTSVLAQTATNLTIARNRNCSGIEEQFAAQKGKHVPKPLVAACASCAVQPVCRLNALAATQTSEVPGYRGGLTAAQRRKHVRELQTVGIKLILDATTDRYTELAVKPTLRKLRSSQSPQTILGELEKVTQGPEQVASAVSFEEILAAQSIETATRRTAALAILYENMPGQPEGLGD